MENMQNGNGHYQNGNGNIPPPPPPNQDQVILQLQQWLEQMRKQMEDQRRQEAPVHNLFVNLYIPGPPVGTRIDVNSFELKTKLIQMVQQHPLAGRAIEDPHRHLSKFMEINNTTKHNGVPDDAFKMRLFPLSLIDVGNDWYESLTPGSVVSWEDSVHKFLNKLFPLSSTLKLQLEISQFHMRDQESIYET